jgi:hypothetical protein
VREGEREIESGRRGLFLRATWHACRARTSTGVVTLLPAQLEARRKKRAIPARRGRVRIVGCWRVERGMASAGGRGAADFCDDGQK